MWRPSDIDATESLAKVEVAIQERRAKQSPGEQRPLACLLNVRVSDLVVAENHVTHSSRLASSNFLVLQHVTYDLCAYYRNALAKYSKKFSIDAAK